MLKLDNFISQILGLEYYKVTDNEIFFDFFNNINLNFKSGTIFSCQFITLTEDLPNEHSKLIKMNFSKVGTLYTYSKQLNDVFLNFPVNKNIRVATINDVNRLKEIAYSNFSDDRFHEDNQISKELANEYYSTWIENCVKGLTDIVWVYEENNEIMGFLSLNYPKNSQNYCQIVLNAIDKPYTRKGRYTELIKHSINHCIEKGFKIIQIGTYQNSIGVHFTLRKLSFTPITYTHYYHFHLK